MYCIDPNSDEPIMLINKHIGYDQTDGQGIDGSLFQQELLQLDAMGKKRIQIWINSPGGVVMDGYSIVNAILKSNTKVDTYCVGIAASIAAVIFQQGRKRIMADYGLLMYHNPFGGNGGDGLDKMRSSIATMISTRTGKSIDDIKKVMDKTTWIEAIEAYNNGFCDEIEVSADLNKKRLSNLPDAKAMYLQGNAVLNSVLSDIKNKSSVNQKSNMKLVTNKLGLNESATEDNILRAIQDIQNKAAEESTRLHSELNAANKSKLDAENKASGLEKEISDKQNELDKMKAELDTLKKEKAEAEAKAVADKKAATKTECENLLKGFVKNGRITTEASNTWLEKVESGKLTVAEVKDMIEAMPLNGKAPKIETGEDAQAGKLGSVINSVMADVREKIEKK